MVTDKFWCIPFI